MIIIPGSWPMTSVGRLGSRWGGEVIMRLSMVRNWCRCSGGSTRGHYIGHSITIWASRIIFGLLCSCVIALTSFIWKKRTWHLRCFYSLFGTGDCDWFDGVLALCPHGILSLSSLMIMARFTEFLGDELSESNSLSDDELWSSPSEFCCLGAITAGASTSLRLTWVATGCVFAVVVLTD